MTASSISEVAGHITVGVDTHRDTHMASAKDELGRDLGQFEIPSNRRGYADLLAWARRHRQPLIFGIEGTSSYGSGLARFLGQEGERVVEVVRPNRQDRRLRGKSDPIDAELAAGAVLSGQATAIPKAGDGGVEMVRALRIAKVTAIKARTQTVNAMKALVVIAPDPIRESLRGLSISSLMSTCSRFRVDQVSDPSTATKCSLRSMARRYTALDAEITEFENRLDALTQQLVPQLRACFGVGQDVATTLLLTAGDNGARLRSESAFSMLCGSSPVPASSGVTHRHRLNRGGDRQANAALYRVVLTRLRWHEPTRSYMLRRRAQGLSKKEVIRCLKRYVARELYGALKASPQHQLHATVAA